MSVIKFLLFLIRLVLIVSSLFVLYELLLPLGYSAQGSARLSWDWDSAGLLFVPIYFLYCIITCTGLLRTKVLLVTGIVMNIGLALIAGGVYSENGNKFALAIAGYFIVIWIVLYVVQTLYQKSTSIK